MLRKLVVSRLIDYKHAERPKEKGQDSFMIKKNKKSKSVYYILILFNHLFNL